MSLAALRRRRRVGLLALSTLAALSSVAVAVVLTDRGDAAPTRPCRMTLIPAYVPPGALTRLVAGSDRPRLIVVNPASGPGTHHLPAYERAVRAVREAGSQVLGYVPTGYGTRDQAAVKADVDRYAKWYGVDGIFLDEVAHSVDHLPYYRALSTHVRASGAKLVVVNPGVVPARGYFDLADVVVTFEGPFADYARAQRETLAWLQALPPERIAHLVYAASARQARELAASSPHARYVYATDGVAPNPWSAIPDYLEDHEQRLATCR